MTMTKKKIVRLLEKRYPKHNFTWKEKNGRIWKFYSNQKHNNTHPKNFNVLLGGGSEWHCKYQVCGISRPIPSNIDSVEYDISIFKKRLQDKILHSFNNIFIYYLQNIALRLIIDVDIKNLLTFPTFLFFTPQKSDKKVLYKKTEC